MAHHESPAERHAAIAGQIVRDNAHHRRLAHEFAYGEPAQNDVSASVMSDEAFLDEEDGSLTVMREYDELVRAYTQDRVPALEKEVAELKLRPTADQVKDAYDRGKREANDEHRTERVSDHNKIQRLEADLKTKIQNAYQSGKTEREKELLQVLWQPEEVQIEIKKHVKTATDVLEAKLMSQSEHEILVDGAVKKAIDSIFTILDVSRRVKEVMEDVNETPNSVVQLKQRLEEELTRQKERDGDYLSQKLSEHQEADESGLALSKASRAASFAIFHRPIEALCHEFGVELGAWPTIELPIEDYTLQLQEFLEDRFKAVVEATDCEKKRAGEVRSELLCRLRVTLQLMNQCIKYWQDTRKIEYEKNQERIRYVGIAEAAIGALTHEREKDRLLIKALENRIDGYRERLRVAENLISNLLVRLGFSEEG